MKTRKKIALVAASELYNNFLNIYVTQYDKLSMYQNKKILNRPENLTFDLYLDEDEDGSPPMPPLEIDEGVKEGKGLKTLTRNKLLTRLPVLLAIIKAENSSYKIKNEIRQIVHLLYQNNKITKKIKTTSSSCYNNGKQQTCNNHRT